MSFKVFEILAFIIYLAIFITFSILLPILGKVSIYSFSSAHFAATLPGPLLSVLPVELVESLPLVATRAKLLLHD